jgi:hypothetical protein
MQVSSWNFWGLNDHGKKYFAHQMLTFLGGIDVLCLQEVKVTGLRCAQPYLLFFPEPSVFFLTIMMEKEGLLFWSLLNLLMQLFTRVFIPCSD